MTIQLTSEPKELMTGARRFVKPCDVVLDVGCGYGPQCWLGDKVHICVEPHFFYFQQLEFWHGSKPGYELHNCEWRAYLPSRPDKSVDTVIGVDFIEHLTKDDGLDFLAHAERIARQQIVIFTPWGLYPQNYDDPTIGDLAGIPGLHWQTHRSGWVPDDFAGWTLYGCEKYHQNDGHGQPLPAPIGAFWAIKDIT